MQRLNSQTFKYAEKLYEDASKAINECDQRLSIMQQVCSPLPTSRLGRLRDLNSKIRTFVTNIDSLKQFAERASIMPQPVRRFAEKCTASQREAFEPPRPASAMDLTNPSQKRRKQPAGDEAKVVDIFQLPTKSNTEALSEEEGGQAGASYALTLKIFGTDLVIKSAERAGLATIVVDKHQPLIELKRNMF